MKRHSISREKCDSLPYNRLYSPKNIEKLVKLVEESDWTSLYNSNSPDSAYTLFHHKINKCYDDSFKLVRLSRKRARDEIWITLGIKNSSNNKNKLYKKWLCSQNEQDKSNYKSYLKIFKKVVLAAQLAYYKERFDTRINTTKQLWIN